MADSILIIGLGFTGKLVLEYLSKHPERNTFTLQAGGRSPSKIASIISDVGATDVKVVVFDLANYADVEKAVLGTTVVINCAGPFARYGGNVVKACALHGKHYVDISGETHWQAEMIERYDYVAWKTGATIVPASCYDSIPSDLSAYTSVQALKTLIGPNTKVANCTSAFRVKGAFSGGTAATIMNAFELSPSDAKRGSKPYALSPVKGRPVHYPQLLYSIPELTHKPIIGGFYLMSGANNNIVRRTWGLLQSRASSEESYGDAFDYNEFMQMPTRRASLQLSLTIFVGAVLAMTLPLFRWFMKTFVIPKSGEGPSPEALKTGMFQVTNVATSVPCTSSPRPRTVRTVFTGHGDPGYGLGSVMVSECALALLPVNRDKLTDLGRQGGILTPVTAFGKTISDRLVASGKFEITSGELLNGGATETKKLV